jgi:polysaccharide export outer membrane protein
MRVALLVSMMAIFVLMLVACVEADMPTTLRQAPSCPLTLGPEDVVTVRVFQEDGLSGDYQADTSGHLIFPFVGDIDITGTSITSLADHITTKLRDGEYLVQPQVTVVIKQHNSARIVVDGRVSRPGSFPFRTGLSLLEAISLAGGMTPMANPRQVRLTRATGEDPETVVVPVRAIQEGREPDVQLCPGDSVYVPESVM